MYSGAREMCHLKKAIWREYNEEIREALSSLEKVRHTTIPTTENERNYLKRMNLPDARTYFRVRCKITNYIKGNRSSLHRNNMSCRYCSTGEDETQEHMENCEFSSEIRKGLNLAKERDLIIMWRKLNTKLYKVYNKVSSREENLRRLGLYIPDNTKEINKIRKNRIGQNSDEECTNSPDVNGEACEHFREELEFHATAASRARDMQVDAVIIHPP